METPDFFIAYASPDRRQAEELSWLLEEEQCTAFIDTQLPLGTPWPTALLDALEAARAMVLLVSSRMPATWYAQDEIARAMQRARQAPEQYALIPVLLDGPQQGIAGMPYGTGILQALDATRPGVLKRVARELADWLTQQESAPPPPPLSATDYQALGAALRLDRYPQWSGVLDACGRPGHVLFLLHGPRHQNVGLFVQRIQRYLSSEARYPHLVYPVRFNLDGMTPRTGADWLRHVRSALTDTRTNRTGSLAQAAKQQPVFLILGLNPLDRLDATQQHGLQECIETALPELLRRERPANDVRVLLALDYDGTTVPALVSQAQAWGRTAQTSGVLRYLPLQPVTLPIWEDVAHYIDMQSTPPSPATLAALQQEYQRLTSGRASTYQELADLIDRYLQDA